MAWRITKERKRPKLADRSFAFSVNETLIYTTSIGLVIYPFVHTNVLAKHAENWDLYSGVYSGLKWMNEMNTDVNMANDIYNLFRKTRLLNKTNGC